MASPLTSPGRASAPAGAGACRFCGTPLAVVFADLGAQPLANAFLRAEDLHRPEPCYPLRAYVCERCFLVQLEQVVPPEAIFTEYPYFSSYSASWLQHARAYAAMAVDRFGLSARSFVVEVGSNDGYLLQYFVERGIPVLGVEPAANVAEAARQRGVPTAVRFFGEAAARDLVAQYRPADLIVGNNVLAQVPDLNGFVAGLAAALAPRGVVTLEFPHLLNLMTLNQFDTIYHEHFSYFSLTSAERIFAACGLTVFDVEELPTHGGSLRLYVRHAADRTRPVEPRVAALRAREAEAGLTRIDGYRGFEERVRRVKRRLLRFLIDAADRGEAVVGYGAPAKGNVLLNYCGVRTDLLEYTVDASPHKQGRFLPGTRIPIRSPAAIRETRPDYVLILPWNLTDEVTAQHAYVREWGGRFVVPIPEVRVLP